MHAFEICVSSHSTSVKMAELNHTTSCQSAIICTALSCNII